MLNLVKPFTEKGLGGVELFNIFLHPLGLGVGA